MPMRRKPGRVGQRKGDGRSVQRACSFQHAASLGRLEYSGDCVAPGSSLKCVLLFPPPGPTRKKGRATTRRASPSWARMGSVSTLAPIATRAFLPPLISAGTWTCTRVSIEFPRLCSAVKSILHHAARACTSFRPTSFTFESPATENF